MELHQQIEEAAAAVRRHSEFEPAAGLILGTGLGSLADRIEETARIPYAEIPHFAASTVDTHAGEFVLGQLAGKPVVTMSGRVHGYEGYSMQQVTFPVRVMRALGAKALLMACAAGGLNPLFRAGDLMLVTDHINFMGDNPLIGPNDDALGPRFPDMSEPYAREFLALAEQAALEKGLALRQGVYLACTGPCLETRAEYRFMRAMGADAVGMSTVPETIVAVHAGLKVLALCVITDECFPDALEPADVPKIIATAKAAEPKLADLMHTCLERMAI